MEWAAQLPRVARKLRESNVDCRMLRQLVAGRAWTLGTYEYARSRGLILS